MRVGRVNLAVPVVGQADSTELLLKTGDIALGHDGRLLAGLDRVLLGGQAKGVPAHRVQDIVALGLLEALERVGGRVALGWPMCRPAPEGYGNMSSTYHVGLSVKSSA